MKKLSDQVQRRVRAALMSAAFDVSDNLGTEPKGSDVVFRALCDALETLKRLPDPDRRWLHGGGRSCWPGFTLTPDERVECYRQLVWLVIKGLEPEDVLISRPPVSPQEQATMDDVFVVFRSCLVGPQTGRDWRILSTMARGYSAREAVRKLQLSISARNAQDRKTMQCQAIARKLSPFMPV